MPVASGGSAVARVFLGASELLTVYRGATPVFDRTPAGVLGILVDNSGNYLVDRAGTYLHEAAPFEAPPPEITDYLLTEEGDRLTLEDGTPIALDGTINGLPVAVDLDGTEWVFVVQSGLTMKCRLSEFVEFVDG